MSLPRGSRSRSPARLPGAALSEVEVRAEEDVVSQASFEDACGEMTAAFAAVENVAAAAEFAFDTAAANLLAREAFGRLSGRRASLLVAQMKVGSETLWEAARMSHGLMAALTTDAAGAPARGSAR